MDFKQLVMGEADIVYQNMSKGTTISPLSRNVSVAESNAYSKKRGKYLSRLIAEQKDFNRAIKEINDANAKRMAYEKQRRMERQQRKEKFASFLKQALFWSFVVVLIVVNLVFAKPVIEVPFYNSLNDVFVFADWWNMLWPSWIAISISLLVTGMMGRRVFKKAETVIKILSLEVAALLGLSIVLAFTFPPNDSIPENIIGTILICAIGYVVPVGVSGLIINICRRRAAREVATKKFIKTFAVSAIIVGSLVALFRFTVWPRLPSTKYYNAIELRSEQKLFDAYSIFNEIDYKDSAYIAGEIRMDVIFSQLTNAQVGDTIIMGTYLQDTYKKKNYEDIEWIVLDKQDNKLLVVSKYAIANSQYYDWNMFSATWEKSIIRKWLNDEFYYSAFNSDEIEMILTTLVETPNSIHNIDGGNPTNDKLFCLSVEEANRYFSNDAERVAESIQKYNDGDKSWWLRTPGKRDYYSSFVSGTGKIELDGANQYGELKVRPAMWVKIPD